MRKLWHRHPDVLPIVTPVEFQRALDETDGPLVVDFFARGCAPCRLVGPLLERLAAEHPEIRVIKVDVDRSPEIAWRYRVRSLSTVMRFDASEPTATVVGAVGYDVLCLRLGLDAGGPRLPAA